MFWNLKKILEDKDFSELIKGGGMSFVLRFVGLVLACWETVMVEWVVV